MEKAVVLVATMGVMEVADVVLGVVVATVLVLTISDNT